MNKAYLVLALFATTNLLPAAARDESVAQTAALIAATGTLPATSHSAAERPPYDITVPLPSFCTPCDGRSLPGASVPLVAGAAGVTLGGTVLTADLLAIGLTYATSGLYPYFAIPMAMTSLFSILGGTGCLLIAKGPCKNKTYTFGVGEGQPLISGHEPMSEDRESLDISASSDGSDVASEG